MLSSPRFANVLRGGFGIFYDTGQALGAAGYSSYPFSAFNILSNVPVPAPTSALTPPALNFPLVPPFGFLSGISDPHLALPYTEQWNLSLDQHLGTKNLLTMSYVGNTGRKLLFTQYFSAVPNPNFTQMQLTSNAAWSRYDALQVQDSGYAAPGLQLIASYTWAHAIDNASTDLPTNAPEKGNSANDLRQVFNAALNYKVPSITSRTIFRAITNGWYVDRYRSRSRIAPYRSHRLIHGLIRRTSDRGCDPGRAMVASQRSS
jgi:hypothetical protein